jgi:hypothetical protein
MCALCLCLHRCPWRPCYGESHGTQRLSAHNGAFSHGHQCICGLQGLSTAGTAPPYAFGHDYSSSVQPAPTELNISGIAPAQAGHHFFTSARAEPAENTIASGRPTAHTVPCGSISSCALLSMLALITAGAWTFAGLCIHRMDRTDAVDLVWEQRTCTVRPN